MKIRISTGKDHWDVEADDFPSGLKKAWKERPPETLGLAVKLEELQDNGEPKRATARYLHWARALDICGLPYVEF